MFFYKCSDLLMLDVILACLNFTKVITAIFYFDADSSILETYTISTTSLH